MRIKSVDEYLAFGCGRCQWFQSPKCKVHPWQSLLWELRAIALEAGLVETIKWGVPCYTNAQDKNICIIAAFKSHVSLSFFKGSLLKDPLSVLGSAGPNGQAGTQWKFQSLKQIQEQHEAIVCYLQEALAIEASGIKPTPRPTESLPMVEEFQSELEFNPALKKAFFNLSPGRQKGYLIFFAQAKQSTTRSARVQKYLSKILSGKGMLD